MSSWRPNSTTGRTRALSQIAKRLKNKPDMARQFRRSVLRFSTEQCQGTRVRLAQTVQHAHKCAFARAGEAGDDGKRAARDGDVDIAQIVNARAVDFEIGPGHDADATSERAGVELPNDLDSEANEEQSELLEEKPDAYPDVLNRDDSDGEEADIDFAEPDSSDEDAVDASSTE